MTNSIIWFLVSIELLLLVLAFLLVIFMVYTIYAIHTGAPFLPTSKKSVETMVELMNLKSGEKLVDLGSGDGRILFEATKKTKYIKAEGIEINPVVYWWSKIKNKIMDSENIKIYRKNFWDVDLSDTDVLAIFFIGDKMDELEEKIKEEMQPGTRVVSHAFQFSDWKPKKQKGGNYLYIV